MPGSVENPKARGGWVLWEKTFSVLLRKKQDINYMLHPSSINKGVRVVYTEGRDGD